MISPYMWAAWPSQPLIGCWEYILWWSSFLLFPHSTTQRHKNISPHVCGSFHVSYFCLSLTAVLKAARFSLKQREFKKKKVFSSGWPFPPSHCLVSLYLFIVSINTWAHVPQSHALPSKPECISPLQGLNHCLQANFVSVFREQIQR